MAAGGSKGRRPRTTGCEAAGQPYLAGEEDLTRGKNKRGDIDWSVIRQEYITGNTSYRKLAAKYGHTKHSVERAGQREGWAEKRREYREGLLKETMDRVQAAEAEQAADRLLVLRSAADRMTEVINRVFDDADQFYRHMVQSNGGRVTCERHEKVDTRAIRDLTGSIKDLAGVLRDLYDLPTIGERQAMELAREKLDMEKAKAAAAGEEPGEITVEFEGGADDYAG